MTYFKCINDFNNYYGNCVFCNEPTSLVVIFNYSSNVSSQIIQDELVIKVDSDRIAINIYTNEITGNPNNFQKIFWYRPFTLSKQCDNIYCGWGYSYETETMVLERKNLKIYPFFIKIELISAEINGTLHHLYNINKSATYSKHTILNSNKLLPRLDLRAMTKEQILNKIKTILVFS